MEKDDRTLIDDALGGDEGAYDLLMQRYQRLVFKIAYGYTGTQEDALDLCQDIFLKAFRGLPSLKKRQHFKTWLIRVAMNEGVSWTRRHRRHIDGREDLSAVEFGGDGQPPAQETEQFHRERQRYLFRGMHRLRHRYRQALILRYFQDQSIREIAGTLGCSEAVAKNTLFRGVRTLRRELRRV